MTSTRERTMGRNLATLKEVQTGCSTPLPQGLQLNCLFSLARNLRAMEKGRIGRSSLKIVILQLTTFRSSASRIHSVLPFLEQEVLRLLSSCFTLQKQEKNSLYKSSYRGGIFPAVCWRLKTLTRALTSHFMQQAELLKQQRCYIPANLAQAILTEEKSSPFKMQVSSAMRFLRIT